MLYADMAISFLRGSTYALYSSLSIGLPNWSTRIKRFVSSYVFIPYGKHGTGVLATHHIGQRIAEFLLCLLCLKITVRHDTTHVEAPAQSTVNILAVLVFRAHLVTYRMERTKGIRRVVPRLTYNNCPLWFSIPPHSSTSDAKFSGS